MANDFKFEAVGVKEALRVLGTVDKQLRNEIRRDYRALVKPVVDDIRSEMPELPMSGWAYPYRKGGQILWKPNEKSKVAAYTSTQKPRGFNGFVNNLGVFGIRWRGGVASLFDLAHTSHTPQGKSMIDTLNLRYGSAKSRIMYKNLDKDRDRIEAGITVLVKRVEARLREEFRR
jgi:hypothetical protein